MKLGEYLNKNNQKPADLARAFGVVHCMARRWCNGEAIPNKEYMQKIFEYTSGEVTPNDFFNINNGMDDAFSNCGHAEQIFQEQRAK